MACPALKLVEDLHAVLNGWTCPITVVSDSMAAWARLGSGDIPGLVILDASLPGNAAIDLCRYLRERDTVPRSAYVVVIEPGDDGTLDRDAAFEAEVDQILPRGHSRESLAQLLMPAYRVLDYHRRTLRAEQTLREQAARDSLTGLWNRGAILETLKREVARVGREGGRLGVVLLDVDHFKRINDTHGHLAGDSVLREVGRRLRTSGRRYDLVGRYGGDEFLAILPGCSLRQTHSVAERLRLRISSKPIRLPFGRIQLGASAGATAWVEGEATGNELILLADTALYRAKEGGRGRAEFSVHPPPRTGEGEEDAARAESA